MNFIKRIINKKKVLKLADIIDSIGILNKDEKDAVIGISAMYYRGARTEEDFIRGMVEVYDKIHGYPFYDLDIYKKQRRTTTWFLQSAGFREKMLHFCLSYFIPFLEKRSFFEICAMHKKYRT